MQSHVGHTGRCWQCGSGCSQRKHMDGGCAACCMSSMCALACAQLPYDKQPHTCNRETSVFRDAICSSALLTCAWSSAASRLTSCSAASLACTCACSAGCLRIGGKTCIM